MAMGQRRLPTGLIAGQTGSPTDCCGSRLRPLPGCGPEGRGFESPRSPQDEACSPTLIASRAAGRATIGNYLHPQRAGRRASDQPGPPCRRLDPGCVQSEEQRRIAGSACGTAGYGNHDGEPSGAGRVSRFARCAAPTRTCATSRSPPAVRRYPSFAMAKLRPEEEWARRVVSQHLGWAVDAHDEGAGR